MHSFHAHYAMYHQSSSQKNAGHEAHATVQQAAEGARRAALQEHSDPNCQAAK